MVPFSALKQTICVLAAYDSESESEYLLIKYNYNFTSIYLSSSAQ